MNITLEREKPVPLARQIQTHVERLIHERRLGPGAKLPATRELARELGVNRATVAQAYEELIAAGLARAHVGQGTFVADGTPPARVTSGTAPRTSVSYRPPGRATRIGKSTARSSGTSLGLSPRPTH